MCVLWAGLSFAGDPFGPFLPCVNTLLDTVDAAAETELEPPGDLLDHYDLGLLGLALDLEQSRLSATQARIVQFDALLRPLFLEGHLELALATEWISEGIQSYEDVRDAFARFAVRYPSVSDQILFLDRVALRTVQSAGDIEKLLGKGVVNDLARSNFAELRLLILYHIAMARPRVVARVGGHVRRLKVDPSGNSAALAPWPTLFPATVLTTPEFESGSLGRFLKELSPTTRLLFVQTHEYFFSDPDRELFAEVFPDTAHILRVQNGVRLSNDD
ncbi:MAG: hypothetical protein R3B54_15110 [Bdellovibrionota bacterium]